MRKKGVMILLLACLALMVFAAEGFGGKAWQATKKRNVHEERADDAGTAALKDATVPGRHRPPGIFYQTDCEDIDPEVGAIIQHDQIGHTWYDFQKNGSMGRMISVASDGYRHFSWMFTEGPFGGTVYRYVDANCKNPLNQYAGQAHVYGGISKNAGYCNQTHLSEGTSVVIYHRTGGQLGDPRTNTMLSIADSLCSEGFSRGWDLPDSLLGGASGEKGLWPRVATTYDPIAERDYIHVVTAEGYTAG